MLKCSPTFTPPSFGLPIPSPRFPGRVNPGICVQVRPGVIAATECPGPLCQMVGVTHHPDDLSDHLRGHYPSFIAPTGPCVRPASSIAPRVAPCALGLCRLLRAPAGCWSFPTLSLPSLWRCSDPYHVVSASCTYPFLR